MNPNLSQIAAIAAKEFFIRLRSGWVIACAAVWLGAIALTSFYGLVQVGQLGMQGYERTVISLLNLVQYLVPLLGLLISHDLVVAEREDRVLALVIASGVARWRLILGKLLGSIFALSFPLLLGFGLAGTAIGLATQDRAFGSFLFLAATGLGLGIIFATVGLLISTVSRTRVQALALALLTWCTTVFAFDLVALGVLISAKAPAVAQEIEAVCDATHINSAADLHAAYEVPTLPVSTPPHSPQGSGTWLFLNPVDLFRILNLRGPLHLAIPMWKAALICVLWIGGCTLLSLGRFRTLDL